MISIWTAQSLIMVSAYSIMLLNIFSLCGNSAEAQYVFKILECAFNVALFLLLLCSSFSFFFFSQLLNVMVVVFKLKKGAHFSSWYLNSNYFNVMVTLQTWVGWLLRREQGKCGCGKWTRDTSPSLPELVLAWCPSASLRLYWVAGSECLL